MSNNTDEKLSNKTNRDKFIHAPRYFKPFDMEGDGNCMYHELTLGMNELKLEGSNDKWNQCTLRDIICKYYTDIHCDENHQNNSLWKLLFSHISENEVTEDEIMRRKLTLEQVNKIKFDNFLKDSVPVDDGEINQCWLCL